MSGLFSLDDVKLLYQASQIPDGDDEKKSASLVPKMQNLGLFSKSKDKKGQAEEEEEEEEEEEMEHEASGEEESSADEEVFEEEGEESDGMLDDIGDAAGQLVSAMTDQFFPKQFRVKIQNIRLQNLERRKRDVLIQFQVGVPAERAQEGGLFEEEMATEGVEAEEEGKKAKRKSKPDATAAKAVRTFGTEVVEKLERGRTNVFKKRFSSVWTGAPAHSRTLPPLPRPPRSPTPLPPSHAPSAAAARPPPQRLSPRRCPLRRRVWAATGEGPGRGARGAQPLRRQRRARSRAAQPGVPGQWLDPTGGELRRAATRLSYTSPQPQP